MYSQNVVWDFEGAKSLFGSKFNLVFSPVWGFAYHCCQIRLFCTLFFPSDSTIRPSLHMPRIIQGNIKINV